MPLMRCGRWSRTLPLPFLHGLHIERFKIDLRELHWGKAAFHSSIIEAFARIREQRSRTGDSHHLAELCWIGVFDEKNARLLYLN